MDFNSIEDRRRRGLCETCTHEPTQCFKLKKSWGGMKHERIPLTVPGKVHNGICLRCYRGNDPNINRDRYQHKRGRSHGSNGHPRRANSELLRPRPQRENGSRTLREDMIKAQDEERMSQSEPINYNNNRYESFGQIELEEIFEQGDNEQHHDGLHSSKRSQSDASYEEVTEMNIFNEPVVVKRKNRKSKRNISRDPSGDVARDPSVGGNTKGSTPSSPGRDPSERGGSPQRHSTHAHSPQHSPQQKTNPWEEEEEINNEATLPQPPPNLRQSEVTEDSGESMDELARLIANHLKSEEPVKFNPDGVFVQNSYLDVNVSDDVSVMTPDTCFNALPGRGSVYSKVPPLGEIKEENESQGSGNVFKRSLVSHQIEEPAMPDIDIRSHHTSVGAEADKDEYDEADQQYMESYLESANPDLQAVKEFVNMFVEAGSDEEVIETVTQSLIHDNATSMSMDLALYCLTTLWQTARKSDEMKRRIIFEGSSFAAIIEAMRIYLGQSAAIERRGCCVLWSLAVDPNDRKHVAQEGGCESILNAMKVHIGSFELQKDALGALKVLSFDKDAKSIIRSNGGFSIVSDVMQRYVQKPAIQSIGCVIIGNLAVDDNNHFVTPVQEQQVDVLVGAIMAHPESLEVHEASCYTLVCLASSSVNLDLMRNNPTTRIALDVAAQMHPDEVGNSIFTLLRRLKFDSSAQNQYGNLPGMPEESEHSY